MTVRDQRHLLRRPHHPSAWREGSHPDSERHRDAVVHDTYGPAQRWSVRGHVSRRLQRVLQWWLLAQRLVLLPLLLRAAHWRRHQSTTITSLGTPKSSFKSSFVPLVCRAGRPCHRDLSLLYDELRAFLHLRQWKRHRCEYRPDPNHDLGADSMAVSYTGQLAQSVTDYDGAWLMLLKRIKSNKYMYVYVCVHFFLRIPFEGTRTCTVWRCPPCAPTTTGPTLP